MKMKVSILVLVGVVAIFLFAGCTSYGPGELSDSIREGQWERVTMQRKLPFFPQEGQCQIMLLQERGARPDFYGKRSKYR